MNHVHQADVYMIKNKFGEYVEGVVEEWGVCRGANCVPYMHDAEQYRKLELANKKCGLLSESKESWMEWQVVPVKITYLSGETGDNQ